MLISLCTPIMNRLPDLRRTLPMRIEAALYSPPVEMVILDYNSSDGLEDFMRTLEIPDEIVLTYRRYTGRQYYHQAHAMNLAILASAGEVFIQMGADTYPAFLDFFAIIREMMADYDWLEDRRYKGAITCRKETFIEAGGYDERFEFYGPEDRELAERLGRRSLRKGILPKGMIGNFFTPDEIKVANYREKGTKHQFSRRMRIFYDQSRREGTLIANAGKEWGRWD